MWYSILYVAATLLAFSDATVSDEYASYLGTPGINETYDYVVVGGGNAGLVAAMRLSADGNFSVAVVEAGGFYQDDTSNTTQIPAYESKYTSEPATIDWELSTTSQEQLGGRSILYPQGKTLGGSTARNGMAYQRGTVSFHDGWANAVGDESYSWTNILPFLKKSVSYTPGNVPLRGGPVGATDSDAFDSAGGPLHVSFWNYFVPVSADFSAGMASLGINESPTGLQSGELLGYSQFPATIVPSTQLRDSSQTSFLKAAVNSGQGSVGIYPHTLAKRIVFDSEKTATGVVVSSDGVEYTLQARREVVLAAGTFRSPQLLMASGVGPSDTLEGLDIPVVSDLSGVGQNMMDQPGFAALYTVNGVSQHRLWNNETYIAIAQEEFETSVSGPLTAFASNYLLFERVSQDVNVSTDTRTTLDGFPADWPHLEYIWNTAGAATNTTGDYLALGTVLLAQSSLGSVSINSSDTADPPVVDVSYLSTDVDREIAIEGFKRARTLAAATGVVITEVSPGASIQTDDDIWTWIQATVSTSHHATGTCKMGQQNDTSAVVNSHGCVLGGISSLRVIDASIMPIRIPGQPMATVYGIAEKLSADIIAGSQC